MGKQRENHASSTKELRDSFIYVRNRQELGSVCINISFEKKKLYAENGCTLHERWGAQKQRPLKNALK